ncbi:MAG: hypothetical protein QXQ60_06445, partial [Thermofilum sp.]
YARLRLEVGFESKPRLTWVRVWFLKPVEGTPEEVRRKWEELKRECEERGEGEEPALPVAGGEVGAWSRRVKVRHRMDGGVMREIYVEEGVFERVLPKGFYYAEVYARRRALVGLEFHLTGDMSVSLTFFKKRERRRYYMGTRKGG